MVNSFADRAKDTLKISGIQVSPLELENVLLAHPEKLITDVAVAGVGGYGRTNDERVPRAWVVLSERGKDFVRRLGEQDKGAQQVARELIKWCEAQLSKYKWLRGGVEIVDEVRGMRLLSDRGLSGIDTEESYGEDTPAIVGCAPRGKYETG